MGELRVGSTVMVGATRFRVACINKAFNPDQPRDERGRWSSGGSGGSPGGSVDPSSVPGVEHASTIPAYLSMVDKMHGRPSVEGFILRHGRGYPTDEGSFVGGKPHMCYENTLKASLESDSLTYVEGYISVHGISIHHAWNVDEGGVVRDHTIGDRKGVQGYFGVPLRTDYALRSTLSRGYYGVLVHERYEDIVGGDPAEMVKKSASLEKFNPYHDERGRFSSAPGGGGSSMPKGDYYEDRRGDRALSSSVRSAEFKAAAKKVAAVLGYDENKIVVDAGQPPTYDIPGHKFRAAGTADLNTGIITLYSEGVTVGISDRALEGLVAHEIMHQKYEKFRKDAESERIAALERSRSIPPDPGGKYKWQRQGRFNAVFADDQTLRGPFRADYPTYHKYSTLFKDRRALVKDDGVTPYSVKWYSREIPPQSAYHETLAEMARIHHESGYVPGSPRWRAVYDAVNEHWNKKP